jgi:cysteine desulfurase
MRQTNLDCQAASPLRPEVRAAMEPFLAGRFGNAGSLHHLGMEAREALAAARSQTASLVNAERPECVVFTSDGTESCNLALKGLAFARRVPGRHFIVTEADHPAVLESAAFLGKLGFACTRLAVDSQGFFDPAALEAAITPETFLIAVHLANHDIGTIQPVAEAGRLAQARGIPLFVDAETAAGWMPVDVQALGADLLSFSPHRFYGPPGVGALYCRRGIRPENLIHGGNQEEGRRAGVENVAGIVGAGIAAELAARELPARMVHTRALQERLWAGVEKAVPSVKLNGPPPGPRRTTTNLNLSAEWTEGEGVLLRLDMQGFQVASGSACLGKSVRMPPVLKAIGLSPALAMANIIVSLGMENTEDDIDRFVQAYAGAVERFRAMSPSLGDRV